MGYSPCGHKESDMIDHSTVVLVDYPPLLGGLPFLPDLESLLLDGIFHLPCPEGIMPIRKLKTRYCKQPSMNTDLPGYVVTGHFNFFFAVYS